MNTWEWLLVAFGSWCVLVLSLLAFFYAGSRDVPEIEHDPLPQDDAVRTCDAPIDWRVRQWA